MRDPFWLIGPPRSGSTFWSAVINEHPEVMLTSETRVMTFLYRALNQDVYGNETWPGWIVGSRHDEWMEHLRTEFPGVVERFYLSIGANHSVRWGDKFPHYADPFMDAGLLDMLLDFWPQSQFILLYRDEDDVVRSIVNHNGWVDEVEGRDMYRRIMDHGRAFGKALSSDAYLEIRYEDHPWETWSAVRDFLGLPPSERVKQFLHEQARNPTRYSAPTSW